MEIPEAAPRALDQRAQIRYLRAVQASRSARDRALALVPFYAGARISETVALDLDDLRLSARKAILRIYRKGERVREVPIHAKLREALEDWLVERKRSPDSDSRQPDRIPHGRTGDDLRTVHGQLPRLVGHRQQPPLGHDRRLLVHLHTSRRAHESRPNHLAAHRNTDDEVVRGRLHSACNNRAGLADESGHRQGT